MIAIHNILFSLIVLLSLAGCASQSASTQRYNLPESSSVTESTQADLGTEQALAIVSIDLAEFLDSERLVLQLDDITLHQASQHLWADNLAQQIRRGLRNRLNTLLPDLLVVAERRGLEQINWNLELTIEQFQGRFDGKAVTGGQWKLYDINGKLVMLQAFQIDSVLVTDGYPALVRALGSNLDKLAQQLALQVQQRR